MDNKVASTSIEEFANRPFKKTKCSESSDLDDTLTPPTIHWGHAGLIFLATFSPYLCGWLLTVANIIYDFWARQEKIMPIRVIERIALVWTLHRSNW